MISDRLYNRSLQILTDADAHVTILAASYILLINKTFDYDILLKTLILLASIAIFLSYIFFINDYFDMPYDVKAGKKRLVQDIPKAYSIGIIIGMIVASILLLWIISDLIYAALYFLTYVIGTFYSAPPVRFKTRHVLGIGADILIEKTLPILLIFTFFRYFEPDAILFLFAFSFLQLDIIIHHQIEDYNGDMKAGIKTFVTMVGYYRALYLLQRFVQPLTGITLLLLCIIISININYTFIPGIAMLFIIIYIYSMFSKNKLTRENKIQPVYISGLISYTINVLPLYFALLLSMHYIPFIVLLLITLVSQYYIIHYYFKSFKNRNFPVLSSR